MRILLLSLYLTCACKSVLAQNYESSFITINNTITIPAGERWDLMSAESSSIYYSQYDTLMPVLQIDLAGNTIEYTVAPSFRSGSAGGGQCNILLPTGQPLNTWVWSGDEGFLPVSGPAVIRITKPSSYQGNPTALITYRKQTTSGLTNNISSTSVVIPTSATGDVEVKLEQSADNVTWTECLPGTYNSSTVKRFFRLRAVEK